MESSENLEPNILQKIIQTILVNLGLWCFTRMYGLVDIYSPNGEEVEGITFSNNEDYIEYVSKYKE